MIKWYKKPITILALILLINLPFASVAEAKRPQKHSKIQTTSTLAGIRNLLQPPRKRRGGMIGR